MGGSSGLHASLCRPHQAITELADSSLALSRLADFRFRASRRYAIKELLHHACLRFPTKFVFEMNVFLSEFIFSDRAQAEYEGTNKLACSLGVRGAL